MIFSVLLLLVTALGLPAIVHWVYRGSPIARAAMAVIVGGYWLRMTSCAMQNEFQFFSHGGQGDCEGYRLFAGYVVDTWRKEGVYFATTETHPELTAILGSATLFVNFIAIIGYLDGEVNRFGAVAVIAFTTALTAINMHQTAVSFGAPPKRSLLIVALFYFSPGLVFHTADTYKDGFVLFFTANALLGVYRLSRHFTIGWVVAVLLSLWGLWYTRFYFIYMTLAPLSVSLLGLRSKSIIRPILVGIAVAVVGIISLAYLGKSLGSIKEKAERTYEIATSNEARDWNERGGSGVDFDDGGDPFAKLPQKLAYTMLAPFPWMGGSFGLQVGKIDATLIYFLLFRAYFAVKKLWREDRALLFMLFIFIVPSIVAYALTMANVGLILRQRLPIVAILTVMACVSWETDLVDRKKEVKKSPREALLEKLASPAE